MQENQEKELLGYVVIANDKDKEESKAVLTLLADKTKDPDLIKLVEGTEVITETEAESINPDLFSLEKYEEVVDAMMKHDNVVKAQAEAKLQMQRYADSLSNLPRSVRRKYLKAAPKTKRAVKKLGKGNNYIAKPKEES